MTTRAQLIFAIQRNVDAYLGHSDLKMRSLKSKNKADLDKIYIKSIEMVEYENKAKQILDTLGLETIHACVLFPDSVDDNTRSLTNLWGSYKHNANELWLTLESE